MSIRRAEMKDVESIMAIFNHAIEHTTAVYNYEPYSFEMMQEWYLAKINKGRPILVYEQDNKAIAFATYDNFRLRPAYQFSVEHSVYVDINYRKNGIAKALMLKLIELAQAEGIHTLIGGIDAENAVSADFHEKLGFKEVAHLAQVGYKFNRWLDLKFFQLILK